MYSIMFRILNIMKYELVFVVLMIGVYGAIYTAEIVVNLFYVIIITLLFCVLCSLLLVLYDIQIQNLVENILKHTS